MGKAVLKNKHNENDHMSLFIFYLLIFAFLQALKQWCWHPLIGHLSCSTHLLYSRTWAICPQTLHPITNRSFKDSPQKMQTCKHLHLSSLNFLWHYAHPMSIWKFNKVDCTAWFKFAIKDKLVEMNVSLIDFSSSL